MALPRWRHVLSASLLCLAAVCVLVRLTVRDEIQYLSLLYYALPIPVLAALVVAGALLRWRGGHLGPTLALSVLGVSLFALWIVDVRVAHECRQSEESMRLVFWNVAGGESGWEEIAESMLAADADIMGMVESGYHEPDPVTYWRRQFPGYSVWVVSGGLAIATRGEVYSYAHRDLGPDGHCGEFRIGLAGRSLRVFVVDVTAFPFADRRSAVAALESLLDEDPEIATIVMGDFNTPDDSAWFDGLREKYLHLFRQAGNGFLPTWPRVAPILALDHIWISPHLAPLCAHTESVPLSDHVRIHGEVTFRTYKDPIARKDPAPIPTVSQL